MQAENGSDLQSLGMVKEPSGFISLTIPTGGDKIQNAITGLVSL